MRYHWINGSRNDNFVQTTSFPDPGSFRADFFKVEIILVNGIAMCKYYVDVNCCNHVAIKIDLARHTIMYYVLKESK